MLLRASHISISFGPLRILDDVGFDLRAGEIHVLAGENGAGKSTLIKILAGIHRGHEGTIELKGKTVRFGSPQDASRAGVAVIHQELSLVESMSAADNLFLGREVTRCQGLVLDRSAQLSQARSQCARIGLELANEDLERPVEEFPLSVKNRLEIAKALAGRADVLVMDEPTSALDRSEVEAFFQVVERLKREGCGIIYISHKMEEIYRLADRITVLRDGRHVGTATATECPEAKLVRWMIGRDLPTGSPARPPTAPGPVKLEVRGLRVPHRDPALPPLVDDLSFAVRAGEVLGLVGLQGSGCAEILPALSGARGRLKRGAMRLNGAPYDPAGPADAIAAGVAWLTAERKSTGLVPGLSVAANATLASVPRISPGGWLRPRLEDDLAGASCRTLQVRLRSLAQPVETLSGGNQQKVILARWLETDPQVLLLEEPTRGVDVGAKHEIHRLIGQWTGDGLAIILVSSEMPEVLRLCDRILVLHRGQLAAELGRSEATPERILAAAMGAAPAIVP